MTCYISKLFYFVLSKRGNETLLSPLIHSKVLQFRGSRLREFLIFHKLQAQHIAGVRTQTRGLHGAEKGTDHKVEGIQKNKQMCGICLFLWHKTRYGSKDLGELKEIEF